MQKLKSYDVDYLAYDTGELTAYFPTDQDITSNPGSWSIQASVWKADTKPKNAVSNAWMVLNEESEYGVGLEFRMNKKYEAKDLALAYRLNGETSWKKLSDAKFSVYTYGKGTNKNTWYARCTNYTDLPSGAFALVKK
jgi:hypothetical protein